jgi:IS5 family transposase
VVKPVIGHLKSGHSTDCNHLKGRNGDAANALLDAFDYNFSILLAWITLIWDFIQTVIQGNVKSQFV